MIIYRTTDLEKWGAGKEARLTKVELDNMMWTIVQRLTAVENNPPQPNDISNITLTGSQLTIYLSDGTIFGPYTLPVAVMRFRGDYADATDYFQLDIVNVTGVGLYLVLQDHTSVSPFDPDATGPSGPLYHLMMPANGSFLNLTDTPIAFGTNGQLVAVNETGDGLIFIDAPSSGGSIDYATPLVVDPSVTAHVLEGWNGKYVIQDASIETTDQEVRFYDFASVPLPNGFTFVFHVTSRPVSLTIGDITLLGHEGINWLNNIPIGTLMQFTQISQDVWFVKYLFRSPVNVIDTPNDFSISSMKEAEGRLYRGTNTDTGVNQIISVSNTQAIAIGSVIYFRQAAARKMELVPQFTNVVNPPFGKTLVSAGVGASFNITKVGANEWDCQGDMEPVV